MSCETITKWGRCQQKPHGPYSYCYFHYAQSRLPHQHLDEYYHEKIVKGLLTPTGEYLSFAEVDTMFAGRPRNDGRRLDKYTS